MGGFYATAAIGVYSSLRTTWLAYRKNKNKNKNKNKYKNTK